MTSPRDLMARLRATLEARADDARAIDAIYRFELDGEQGGSWVVSLRDPVAVTESDGPAECVIGLSAKDFVELFEGKVNGQQLFFAGKLRIDGDMQLALKLQHLTRLMQN